MATGEARTWRRHAYSSGNLSAVFTITQEAHPLFGRSYDFLDFEEVTVKTDAKRNPIKGKGHWPVAHTVAMAEGPTCELGGVPAETRFGFIAWIGDKNGAANTIGTFELTFKLPGLDADSIKLEGWSWENCADFSVKKDGSNETAMGGFSSMLVNGVDPLNQDF